MLEPFDDGRFGVAHRLRQDVTQIRLRFDSSRAHKGSGSREEGFLIGIASNRSEQRELLQCLSEDSP
jgi:hypothetical protein